MNVLWENIEQAKSKSNLQIINIWVLWILYKNIFYACTERSWSTVNQQKSQNLISYEPTVSVSTKKEDNHVLITVSDNGNGVPKNIVDKIFQPFFTTKPTGQGTGLGLSLSYDIVKAQGGEINVESKEGEGSEFIIQLPIWHYFNHTSKFNPKNPAYTHFLRVQAKWNWIKMGTLFLRRSIFSTKEALR